MVAGVVDRFVCTDDGVRLAVRDFGGSGHPLLLIHGFHGNLGQFDTFGPMLADQYRVVAYDQRGHGWSESGPTSVAAYVDDLRTVVDALELDDPVLYGSSFGALVALAYLEAGDAARGFVNEDGQISNWPGDGPGPPRRPDGPRILSADQQQDHLAFWARSGSAGTASAIRSMQALRGGRVELRPTQTELNAKGSAFSELSVIDCYRATDTPVLVLDVARESEDVQADRDAALERLRTICSCEVRRFATGHWITAEHPAAVAAALAEFARRI